METPNLPSLDAWAFDTRKVEKPWGYELIWAHADDYVGKVLFVKAGESLSLQFHREKDESWLVHSGRARLELGSARRASSGYRRYGLLELNQLRSLRELRRRFHVELTDVVFAARLRREPELRNAVDTWLAGTELTALDWEQRKHERLLAA